MIIVNITGLLIIAAIIWWFWLYRGSEVAATEDGLTVTVENGTYQPSRIKLPPGQPVVLQFVRKDQTPCAGTVIFDALGISEELPLNKVVKINLPALEAGEYGFNCQMQMYKGKVIVEE